MEAEASPVVTTEMLIRRPVAQVFRAFIDPEVTARFWFSRGSATLEAGRQLEWHWEWYGASAVVTVLEMEAEERILIEWDDPPTRVEWRFTARADDTTFVTISNWGFSGTVEEVVKQATDAASGFAFVLAGLKAWLEHGIPLRLVEDH